LGKILSPPVWGGVENYGISHRCCEGGRVGIDKKEKKLIPGGVVGYTVAG